MIYGPVRYLVLHLLSIKGQAKLEMIYASNISEQPDHPCRSASDQANHEHSQRIPCPQPMEQAVCSRDKQEADAKQERQHLSQPILLPYALRHTATIEGEEG